MENCLFIGTKVDKETAENMGVFVQMVFKAGVDNGMDQSTIVKALELGLRIGSADHTSVSNCVFTGEKHVHLSEEDDDANRNT